MSRRVYVELNTAYAKKVFEGRKKMSGKPKIPGVIEFNRKMKFVRNVSKAGCPFAIRAIVVTEEKIETLNMRMMQERTILENKQYDNHFHANAYQFEYEREKVDCSDYDETALKLMHSLVIYDGLNDLYTMDMYKRIGRYRSYQKPMMKARRRIRGCMSMALQYVDYGYRRNITTEQLSQNNYKKMAAIYGDPVEKMSIEKVAL